MFCPFMYVIVSLTGSAFHRHPFPLSIKGYKNLTAKMQWQSKLTYQALPFILAAVRDPRYAQRSREGEKTLLWEADWTFWTSLAKFSIRQ